MIAHGKLIRAGTALLFAAAASPLLLAIAAPGAARQQDLPARQPVERLSWYGDPSAPDVSGVWVRVEPPATNGSKEGWLPWPPPLNPSFAALWRKRLADAAAGRRSDDPVTRCLPPGLPRMMTGTTQPLRIIQTPGRVTMLRDMDTDRHIWLDGRGFPKPDDLEDRDTGNSIGHYDGATLVIESIGITDRPIDSSGVPHSNKLKVVERIRRTNAQTLTIEVTLTDALAYTRPMKTTVTYKALTDPLWEPRDVICIPENNYHPEFYVR